MSKTKYITSVIDHKTYCKTNGQFTRHLRNNNLTYQQYIETYITKTSPKCRCGNALSFYQKTETYANSCGDPKCVGLSISNTKRSWTIEQRNTDSNNKRLAASARTQEQIQSQVIKSKETFRKKYDVEWVTQSATYKHKSKKTKFERYGDEYYANSKQTSASWQAMSAEKISEIADKRRATCLTKFGVENALMKPEARTNSAKSNSLGREFVLPSGRVIGVRGYEDITITKLLEIYEESDLQFDDRKSVYDLPKFEYINVNQHTALYYPDILITKENKIIEVKSRWWWDGNGDKKYKSRLTNNVRKKDSVLQQGFEYEVWLFTDKNNYEILTWQK
jgi:hypothetical protein